MFSQFFRNLFRRRRKQITARPTRGAVTHVVILDGTMSSLKEGCETNAGLLYKLLEEVAADQRLSVFYEPGVQWVGTRGALDVIQGHGLDRQIRRAYGFLASRYRPGDDIFLFGYSRGAFAARSLAGMIDQIGLLTVRHATVSKIREAWRHYQCTPESDYARRFSVAYCHKETPIEMIGVWDTVKALGLRAPLLWRLTEPKYAFHNARLGPAIRHGFQALALDESRSAYAPILWQTRDETSGRITQVWFRGTHGDVGGHLEGVEKARPLSNIPLVWMIEQATKCGLTLPDGWQDQFPRNPDAPSLGPYHGWGKFFLARRHRKVGRDPSEFLHESAVGRSRRAKRLKSPPPVWSEPEEEDQATSSRESAG